MTNDIHPFWAYQIFEDGSRKSPGSRLTDEVEFVYGAMEDDDPEGVERASRELTDIAGPKDLGLEFNVHTDGIGRGAEGLALVLQIFGGATAIAASVVTWVEFAQLVARVWNRLRKKRGRPPIVSLGALKLLCSLHLHEQLGGDLDGVRLTFAGDVGGGLRSDFGYTGEDVFFILFARNSRCFLYLIDSIGQLIAFSEGNQQAHPTAPVTLAGSWRDPLPSHYPKLILDDTGLE